jgi:hypothetical protein
MKVRKRWIATQLLQFLKNDDMFSKVIAVGLVSSHPAACTALAKYCSKSHVLIIIMLFAK